MFNQLFFHLRPITIAQLIAELVTDHGDVNETGGFNFRTEEAKDAFATLFAAGTIALREERFWKLVDEALGRERLTQKPLK